MPAWTKQSRSEKTGLVNQFLLWLLITLSGQSGRTESYKQGWEISFRRVCQGGRVGKKMVPIDASYCFHSNQHYGLKWVSQESGPKKDPIQ